MRPLMNRIVYWTSRILGILVVLYACKNVPDYALPGKLWRESAASILVHLIPAFILIGVLAISWRREWIAGMVFVLLGILRFGKDIAASNYDHFWLASVGLLIGVLFLMSWRERRSSGSEKE
jgi:hypothetical protein